MQGKIVFFPDFRREIRHCSTGLPNLFAKSKYSEDSFAVGLQIISRSLMSITLGQIFRFYWGTFLNVWIVLLSQEFLRFISVGQVLLNLSSLLILNKCTKYYIMFLPQSSSHPENIQKKVELSEVVRFVILLPLHFIKELISCLGMSLQLVAKLVYVDTNQGLDWVAFCGLLDSYGVSLWLRNNWDMLVFCF